MAYQIGNGVRMYEEDEYVLLIQEDDAEECGRLMGLCIAEVIQECLFGRGAYQHGSYTYADDLEDRVTLMIVPHTNPFTIEYGSRDQIRPSAIKVLTSLHVSITEIQDPVKHLQNLIINELDIKKIIKIREEENKIEKIKKGMLVLEENAYQLFELVENGLLNIGIMEEFIWVLRKSGVIC